MNQETLTEQELNELIGMKTEELDREARPFEDGSWIDDEGNPIHFTGPITRGRPRLFDEEMVVTTFRLPRSYLTAIETTSAQLGISKSEFLRNAVLHELEAVDKKLYETST